MSALGGITDITRTHGQSIDTDGRHRSVERSLPVVFINVQGKSRFTVDEVNDLMEQLIERQCDGAQLVLVR